LNRREAVYFFCTVGLLCLVGGTGGGGDVAIWESD
jgi:hypothetical protein